MRGLCNWSFQLSSIPEFDYAGKERKSTIDFHLVNSSLVVMTFLSSGILTIQKSKLNKIFKAGCIYVKCKPIVRTAKEKIVFKCEGNFDSLSVLFIVLIA